MLAVEQARDVDDLPCLVEFGDGDLGQPDPAELALGPELPQCAELVGEGYLRIDAGSWSSSIRSTRSRRRACST